MFLPNFVSLALSWAQMGRVAVTHGETRRDNKIIVRQTCGFNRLHDRADDTATHIDAEFAFLFY